jgi:hypothetical protein
MGEGGTYHLTFLFRDLGHHFMKLEDISVSRIVYFVEGLGLLNA